LSREGQELLQVMGKQLKVSRPSAFYVTKAQYAMLEKAMKQDGYSRKFEKLTFDNIEIKVVENG
jgi:hypothetical protein